MSGILKKYKVVDVSRFIAGPYCAMLLGDMGAEVIKIEKPEGDDGRYMANAIADLSTYFMIANRNKKSVTLNLKSPRGKEIFTELVKDADVVVENFRPGVMKRLGFGYEDLKKINPRIIMTSVTGYGQDGPYAHRPSFDSVAQAMGGLMNQTGDDKPVPAGTWVGDYSGGLYAAFGTVLALLQREFSGEGQHVDVSLLDSIVSWLRTSPQDFLLFGKKHQRKGARDTYRCPVGAFETADGYMYITATTQDQFKGVAVAAGHPEWATDPRFVTEACRLENSAELTRLITEWTTSLPTERVLEELIKGDVPCAPINDVEQVLANPQVQYRDDIVWMKCHTGQDIPLPGITVKLSETPGSIRLAPPKLGDYNKEFYGEILGMSEDEIDRLRQEGVI